ncbi:hypothetical protein ALC56_07455, partial [Trachymyrmex septentrionalis]
VGVGRGRERPGTLAYMTRKGQEEGERVLLSFLILARYPTTACLFKSLTYKRYSAGKKRDASLSGRAAVLSGMSEDVQAEDGNEKVMFRPASFVLALRSNTLLQLRHAVVCHNGEQRKLLLALVSRANFTCACSIGHSLKDARVTVHSRRALSLSLSLSLSRARARVEYGPVGEVGGVRLPLQSLHGYGSVFMYSASTSPGGGGGQSSGGGGEVTLRLREPEDIPEEVLARLEDTATLSISLQSDAVLRLGAAGAGNLPLILFFTFAY